MLKKEAFIATMDKYSNEKNTNKENNIAYKNGTSDSVLDYLQTLDEPDIMEANVLELEKSMTEMFIAVHKERV